MIHNRETTPEFTIHRLRCDVYERYLLVLDGDEEVGLFKNEDEARRFAAKSAKRRGFTNAGLTETFGRNRQWVQGPRGGWTRYKEEA